MIEMNFVMEPYDFENVKNVIGPFNLNNKKENEKFFKIIEEIEFSPFGGYEYRIETIKRKDYIIIDNRISYELDSIINDIIREAQ